MATTPTTGTQVPHDASGAFPPFKGDTFLGQVIWLAIAFGLLYWLMAKVALPRVAGILADRRSRIEQDLANAAAARTKAEKAFEAYEKSLGEARARAQSIAQTTRDTTNAQSEAQRKSLEADLAGKLAAAEKRVADTKASAMSNVESIAADAAAAIVERLTGKAPTAAAIGQAVTAALKG